MCEFIINGVKFIIHLVLYPFRFVAHMLYQLGLYAINHPDKAFKVIEFAVL